jgi:hypothetical protein
VIPIAFRVHGGGAVIGKEIQFSVVGDDVFLDAVTENGNALFSQPELRCGLLGWQAAQVALIMRTGEVTTITAIVRLETAATLRRIADRFGYNVANAPVNEHHVRLRLTKQSK